jgi:exodeoxyribonuclease III
MRSGHRRRHLLRPIGCLLVSGRMDRHLPMPAIAALAKRESIYLDQRFSDHAPLTIDYDFSL